MTPIIQPNRWQRLHKRPLSFLAWIIAFWSIINAMLPNGLPSYSAPGTFLDKAYLPINWAVVTFLIASILFFRPLKNPHGSQ